MERWIPDSKKERRESHKRYNTGVANLPDF